MVKFLMILLFLSACTDKNVSKSLGIKDVKPEENIPRCFEFCSTKTILNHDVSGYSYLAFPNFGHRGIGKCRGHAIVTQKMSILGKYKRTNSGCHLNDETCLNSIKKGIDKIMSFQTFEFDSFDSLQELSSVPEIQVHLKNYIKGISHRYRAIAGNIHNPTFDTSEENVFHEIKKRVLEGELPYIGVSGALTGNHALLAYRIDKTFNNRICVRDPNIVLDEVEDCQNFVYLNNGVVYYSRHGSYLDKINQFSLTSDEDMRASKYKKAHTSNCIEVSLKKNLCRN